MEIVSTPYFGFADADDIVEPDMYEKMLRLAKQHSLEVVQCDVFGGAPSETEIVIGKDAVRTRVFDPILIRGTVSAFVWDKLYLNRGRRLAPIDIMMYDDLAMNFQLLEGVERFAYLHEGLYHYRINNQCSIRNFKWKNALDLATAVRIRRKYLPLYGIRHSFFINIVWFMRNFRNMCIVIVLSLLRRIKSGRHNGEGELVE